VPDCVVVAAAAVLPPAHLQCDGVEQLQQLLLHADAAQQELTL